MTSSLRAAVRRARAETTYLAPHTVALAARLHEDGIPMIRIASAIGCGDSTEQATAAVVRGGGEVRWQVGGESWGGGEGGRQRAQTAEEIRAWLADASLDGWDAVESTMWVRNWARPIDPDTGRPIGSIDVEVIVTVAVDPAAPACAPGKEHDWQTPYSVLGGLRENPGVMGNGGGVICKEVCSRCGAYSVTDTWAQDPSTGAQGLTSITYEDADDESLAWIQELRDAAMIEACPYSIDRHGKRGPGRYVISGFQPRSDDDNAADRIIAEIAEAIGSAWTVEWTGDGNGDQSDISIEWVG